MPSWFQCNLYSNGLTCTLKENYGLCSFILEGSGHKLTALHLFFLTWGPHNHWIVF